MFTVITYGEQDKELSVYRTPPGDEVPAEQLAANALDLPGAVRASVWDGDSADGDPILTHTLS